MMLKPISINGKPQKLVYQFKYLGSNISFTKVHVNICHAKVSTDIDKLSIKWKSDLSDKTKQDSRVRTNAGMHQLDTNEMQRKKAIWNYKEMHRAVLKKILEATSSKQQHPAKQQLCGYLPLIYQTILVKRTRYAGEVSESHSCMDS